MSVVVLTQGARSDCYAPEELSQPTINQALRRCNSLSITTPLNLFSNPQAGRVRLDDCCPKTAFPAAEIDLLPKFQDVVGATTAAVMYNA